MADFDRTLTCNYVRETCVLLPYNLHTVAVLWPTYFARRQEEQESCIRALFGRSGTSGPLDIVGEAIIIGVLSHSEL